MAKRVILGLGVWCGLVQGWGSVCGFGLRVSVRVLED